MEEKNKRQSSGLLRGTRLRRQPAIKWNTVREPLMYSGNKEIQLYE